MAAKRSGFLRRFKRDNRGNDESKSSRTDDSATPDAAEHADVESRGGSAISTVAREPGHDHEDGDHEDGDHEDGDHEDREEHKEWLAYDLHEWALESRVMLRQLLTVDQVVHSWQGTTLMVHESLENQVDTLIDEVQETEKAQEATNRPIGPEDDLTAFEIGDWTQQLRHELIDRLVQARVPHLLEESTPDQENEEGEEEDQGDQDDQAAGSARPPTEGDQDAEREQDAAAGWDLWVRESDEERVDLVIDDLLARVEEADFVELDGLEVNSLLSDLFVACDRLKRDPRDPAGVHATITATSRIENVRTPFGFAAPNWRDLRNTAGDLESLLVVETSDASEIRDLASRLSATLRQLI